MKRTLLSLIVAGLFTSLTGTVTAQNVTADDKPANPPSATGMPTDAPAKASKASGDPNRVDATPGTPDAKAQRPGTSSKGARSTEPAAKAAGKADYTAAKAKAKAAYNEAKVKCDALAGDAMRSCMSDAKAARTQALAEAKTQWQGRKGGNAGSGGGKIPSDDTNSNMGSRIDSTPDALQSDGKRDPQGGRLEKSRDDSIVPEAEKFQNVSTARKPPEGAGADKANAN